MAVNNEIGLRVRHYRTVQGMSMARLAERLDSPVSYQQIQKYETGANRWPADMVFDIAALLKVQVQNLFPGGTAVGDGEHEADEFRSRFSRLSAEQKLVLESVLSGLEKL